MELVSSPNMEEEHGWWFMPNVSDSEVLWGGDRGPGLVYIVADLAKTVAKLSDTVADLTKVVSGNEGLQAQVTKLITDAAAEKKATEDRINRLWQVGVPVIVAILLGVGGLVVRAIFVAEVHHL